MNRKKYYQVQTSTLHFLNCSHRDYNSIIFHLIGERMYATPEFHNHCGELAVIPAQSSDYFSSDVNTPSF